MAANRATQRSPKKTSTVSGPSGEEAKRKAVAVKESRGAYHAIPDVSAEARVDLAQLFGDVAELSRRLLAVEAQLSRLRADQLQASDRMTSAESSAWLKLAEPAFAFWDNPKDAIYDTLLRAKMMTGPTPTTQEQINYGQETV